MIAVEWVDSPPPATNLVHPRDWSALAETLRARPNEWACAPGRAALSAVPRNNAFLPRGHFQARSRGGRTFVRYLGPADASAETRLDLEWAAELPLAVRLDWHDVGAALRSRAGSWARLPGHGARVSAPDVRKGRRTGLTPAGAFDAEVRGFDLYLRCVDLASSKAAALRHAPPPPPWTWEDVPPVTQRVPRDWAPIQAALRARAGDWGIVERQCRASWPGKINQGASGFSPAGAYSATQRAGILYARFNGPAEQPNEPVAPLDFVPEPPRRSGPQGQTTRWHWPALTTRLLANPGRWAKVIGGAAVIAPSYLEEGRHRDFPGDVWQACRRGADIYVRHRPSASRPNRGAPSPRRTPR